ncbi:MAG: O-antigen ligase domain-containing protein, partial [Bacteroidota bacterium]|nr:O-antigen ligase domain-containing protein [Bacteroidota bacterium]
MTFQQSTYQQHPFEDQTASAWLIKPAGLVALTVFFALVGWIVAKAGIIGAGAIMGFGLMMVYAVFIFRFPALGLYTAVLLGFLLIGLGRYVKGVQVGLGMDAILVLTFLALFFNRFHQKIDWAPAKKDITLLAAIWFGYSLLEVVNPEARSFEAWFSGRGIGLYMFLIVPMTLLFINSNRKLDIILYIWGICSLLATIKAIMQVKWGVDPWEQGWLNEGNYKTHVLFGKLRAFSFLSDAGQFGANQAYSGVMAAIVAGSFRNKMIRFFFIIVAISAFYGMIISGTRGALSIPFTGFGLYFVIKKNKLILATGALLLVLIVVFFKFTSIGQGNAEIRRMRTAFDPNDASLQVRLANQNKLKSYMASRPFGGGIGHGGVKAQRFLPNAYLSQIPTDSWYVLIWVEQGIVGLLLHLAILFYVLIKAVYLIMFRIKDGVLKA